ncbi:unnamed protein product [Rhizophagus irregularis]|uniref:Tyr recombinase domain-containing protein n=1 Tax=Rhizophagus irregularis TaxID=588596 RepID=A0A2N1MXT0_9GLOM|nr:hypothetical protein RhiirC2_784803 [Rhizophagus irregularis]CAB4397322.1 unnamed protein product [Rhizophagus irregularis]CAB5384511.1 unnamed protein product [Rhizophagus irregularis]CAB5396413.1 unnamed protein product [Rhizophagus irregularis]
METNILQVLYVVQLLLYIVISKNSTISGINNHDQATFPTFWEVTNGKLKFLSDLGLNDAKGADALSMDEISIILNHKTLDSTTPERLLYRIYFYNALLLGIRGKEHSVLLLEKKGRWRFQVYIYRSKTNQRGAFGNADPEFYLQEMGEEDALSSGIWFKRNHIGFNRLKSFMRTICISVGLNISNRKIIPHTGRKTMVQALESIGESTLNIRKQSRHKSDESLRPYLLTGEKDQLRMMENLAEKITGNDNKSRKKFQEITTNLNNSNETSEFDNNNNTFKRASQDNETSESSESYEITKKIQLTISQDELAKIIQSGVLTDSDFNIKLV